VAFPERKPRRASLPGYNDQEKYSNKRVQGPVAMPQVRVAEVDVERVCDQRRYEQKRERMSESQFKPKVLVADDERVIADTLSIILNQAGFEATAVYSGEKAVETAKTLKPDMLISDVIMMDMNGIDAAIKIRGMLPNCKILLFSGQAATADLLDRARVQGHEFEILAKPVHPQDLLARLRS
jgi:CheY-like chemotaxis protein